MVKHSDHESILNTLYLISTLTNSFFENSRITYIVA